MVAPEPPQNTRHPRKVSRARFTLGTLLALSVGAAYWLPALLHLDATGYGDWRVFHHQWEAARVALLRFHEFPLWDPWHCGGVFLFGDPQAQVYSPLFYVLLPLGTTVGLKVFMILHAAAGFGGAYLLARRELRLDPTPSALAAIVWAGSGFFAWHLSGGHGAFAPFYLAPFVVLAFRRSLTHWRASAWVAALMVLTLFEGGVYPFPLFVVLLAFEAVVALMGARDGAKLGVRTWRVLRAGSLSGGLALLAGGSRLLPILHTMQQYPRPTSGDDSLSLRELLAMFLDSDHAYRFGHTYVWGEYGTYVGAIALVLGVLGLVLCAVQWRRPVAQRGFIVLGGLVFTGFTLGSVGPLYPWPLLHHLPIFDSLRVPSRFAVLCSLYLALAAGVLLHHFVRALAKRGPKMRRGAGILAPVMVAVVSAQLYVGNASTIDRWRGEPLPEINDMASYAVLASSHYGDWQTFPALHRGNSGCYTGIEAYHAARGLWLGPALARTRQGRVSNPAVTSSTLEVDVELAREGEVVFDQTWAPGWEASAGEAAIGPTGLLVVRHLAAGSRRLRLSYRPDDLAASSMLAVAGLLAILGVAFWPTRRRKK